MNGFDIGRCHCLKVSLNLSSCKPPIVKKLMTLVDGQHIG